MGEVFGTLTIKYGGPYLQTQQHILETQETIFGTQYNFFDTLRNIYETQHKTLEINAEFTLLLLNR